MGRPYIEKREFATWRGDVITSHGSELPLDCSCGHNPLTHLMVFNIKNTVLPGLGNLSHLTVLGLRSPVLASFQL